MPVATAPRTDQSTARPASSAVCTCSYNGPRPHRFYPSCFAGDEAECPHGADDPLHCTDCRTRAYYERE